MPETRHWIFGYGSLIWRVDFPFHDRRVASVHGWARRFWQGSHDHRGTPDAPGRVVTLIPVPGAVCVGMAYQVDADVFAHLDHREKNGYQRTAVDIRFADGHTAGGITYIAPAGNFAFLGEAPADDIAAQIAASHGPSGANADYLLELAAALRALDAADAHVEGLASRVRRSGRPPKRQACRER
jgi:cation transport regulator ChaC